jgi:flagellar biosynthesis/type III secretory pathway chaperone
MTTEFRALTDEGHLSPTDVIDRSVAVAQQLLDLLKEERKLLAGVDHDALTPVFARKSELATQLSELDQERAAQEETLGIETSTEHSHWALYCTLLEHCREANAINGRLVQDRQRHVRRALGILRGQTDSDPEIYSQRGSTLPGARSQDLGRA